MADSAQLKQLLTEMKQAGVPARRAAIVAAISYNEAGTCFGIQRTPDLIYPTSCYPSRQILRLERGRSADQPLGKEWTASSKLMAWLKANGYLNDKGNAIAGRHLATDSCAAGGNTAMAKLFEFLIDQRLSGPIGYWSIGPTQMYLKWSPLAGGSIRGRFETWDDLFRFYTARTVAELMNGSWWDYLPTNVAYYPTDGSRVTGDASSNDGVERYLQLHQTGVVDWTSQGWRNYASQFLNNVKQTWSTMYSIGYK